MSGNPLLSHLLLSIRHRAHGEMARVPVPKLLWLESGGEVGHLGTLEPGCILPPSLPANTPGNYANSLGRTSPGSCLGLDISLANQHGCNPCPLP